MTEQEIPRQVGWYQHADGATRYWDGSIWVEAPGAPARNGLQSSSVEVPGRVSGFVLGIFCVLVVTIPILSLPLGIIGIVQSRKATTRLVLGAPGRGMAVAGLILSICGVCITSLLMLAAIPGAWVANFG